MRIKAAWDSGPYGYFYAAREGDNHPDVFEADEALLTRYCEAEKAFREAELKLIEAHDDYTRAKR
jgi:hypothetical protein